MFSQKDFIAASRNFVCVRLESYESEEHQNMVRSFLDGRFENTAFCLLAPDGKERLSGAGRSPAMGLRAGGKGPGRGQDGANDRILAAMVKVAKTFPAKGKPQEAVVPDFHTFRQGLNVASADQRLLFYVVAPENEDGKLRKRLRPVMADPEVVGRFHTDFAGAAKDAEWHQVVDGARADSGLYILRADKFGQKGTVMARLPLDAKDEEIKSALLKANAAFAQTEERKIYREHVADGRAQQAYFENGMPYGEDRDGDGKIDHRGGLDRPGVLGAERSPRLRGGPPPRGRRGPPPGDRPGSPPRDRPGPLPPHR